MMDELNLFLDTNSLLHFPPIKDVDWRAVCGCVSVRIVLCLQVIHELDEKKNDPRLGHRASRTIKEIKAIRSAAGNVREGVTLEVFNYEIRATEFPTTLSPDSGDDRIVHSVKKYLEQNPGAQAAVYTEDLGMSLRCEASGLKVIEPDLETRLENPQDEFTKKPRQVTAELDALKNRRPVLTISVAPFGQLPQKDKPFEVFLAPSWTPLDVETEMLQIRQPDLQSLEGRYIFDSDEHFKSSNNVLIPASTIKKLISDEEWNRYRKEMEKYHQNYESYLQSLNGWGEVNDRTIRFDFWLDNSGNSPAEDVDVFLIFPPSLKCVAEIGSTAALFLLRPEPPQPPEPPKLSFPPFVRAFDFAAALTRPFSPQISDRLAGRNSDLVKVWNTGGGYRIHAKVPRLKHGQLHRIGQFLANFESWDNVRPFEAQFTISATELPEQMTDKIPFVIRKKDAD